MARTREDFREYLFDYFLPRWQKHSQDDDGGFQYLLNQDWSLAENPQRRLRVQARQVWVFTKAAALGGGDALRDAGMLGFEYMLKRFGDAEHGGFFLTLTPDGRPKDTHKDLYEHAFVLLACAAVHEATGDARAGATAEAVCELLDRHLADPKHGGYFEGANRAWTPRHNLRRQNPHMHLLEALLAWADIDPGGPWKAKAQSILELFYSRFYGTGDDILREHFNEDWTPAAGDAGESVEPGHHFEWVFLLEEYARIFDEAQWGDATCGLWEWARRHGLDQAGGVQDECNRSGRVVRATKRVWPQTEFLRALAIRYRDSLESKWHDEIEAHLDWMRAKYCADIFPGWNEQLDANGKVITATMHATSVYHIFGAFTTLMDAI
ncbi:MAG: AGE family epimerase/isomerase [Planctomycetota bacterium]|jgi:mannose-6-phosphate isomerase